MPYIKQEKRDVLDPAIEQVLSGLRQLESDDPDNNFEGNMNYVVSTLIAKSYGKNYRDINDVMGFMFSAALEYYIRVASPYEKQKAFENGDVYDSGITTSVLPQKRGNPETGYGVPIPPWVDPKTGRPLPGYDHAGGQLGIPGGTPSENA